MEPTQERAIETSAGMETATETVERINAARQPVNATNVPASIVTNPTPNLQMPDAPVIPTDTGVVAEGRSLLDRREQELVEREKQEGAVVSDGVRSVNELMGIINTESAKRSELEGQVGVESFSQNLRQFQESLRRQVAQLDQFDVDNVNTLEQMRVDASKRDITKRTFGAMSAEANIQNAVRRANMVASTRATIAAIDVTQGNLQAATEQVDKALNAIYEPVRQQLQMEQFFLERNDRRFDVAQKELSNTRMMQIQQSLKEIDRAQVNVDSAVSTGFATEADINAMMALSSDPEEQNKYALNIMGKASRFNMALKQAEIQARINATRQAEMQAGQEAQAAAMNTLRATTEHTKEAVSAIDRIAGQTLGIRASTGLMQNALATGFAATTPFAPAAPGAATLGRFIPGVGLALNTAAAGQQKQAVMSDLTFLVNDVTFSTMRRLKEQGVTFGALTEGERVAIGKSADALFSALEIDDSGTVVGIRTTEDAFNSRLTEFREKTLRYQDEANIVAGQLNQADEMLIRQLP